MPETSIVIKAHDRYSDAMKTMKDASKAFGKDVDSLQDKLDALNKTKATLKVDTDKARAELKEAEKAFAKTGDAADELDVIQKRLTFENARRNLALVSKEAAATEKQMLKTGNAISKVRNRVGSGEFSKVVEAIATTGGSRMVSSLAQDAANTMAGSMLGSEGGSIFSSALSSAISGAAIGNIVPGIGTAVGALTGAGIGAVSGVVQNLGNKDDAFRFYVQSIYGDVTGDRETDITNGSSIASNRQQKRLAFATLLGSDEAAAEFMADVKTMAAATNYSYDDITEYAKSMVGPFGAGRTLSILQTMSDASAALSLDSSDNATLLAGLSRMQLTGQTTQEYLKYFSERGIDVYAALSDWGDAAAVAEKVTAGKIGGSDAVTAILNYMNEQYGGLSEKMAGTYEGVADNLEDIKSNIEEQYGIGYNDTRLGGIEAESEAYGGALGDAMGALNSIIGSSEAYLDNLSEQYQREAMEALLLGENTSVYSEEQTRVLQENREKYVALMDQYEQASEEEKAAIGQQMGALRDETEAFAQSAYDASAGMVQLRDTQLDLIDAIRENTAALGSNAWSGDYQQNQRLGLGLASTILKDGASVLNMYNQTQTYNNANGYAVGIDYVPYDNFPALLHQGERVQTAVEARSDRGGGSVTVTGNTFVIREEADVGRVAAELLERMELAEMRG